MKIIVGLGNPGKTHLINRHNAGYLAVDQITEKLKRENWSEIKKLNARIIKLDGLVLVKSTTYMNKVGIAVKKIINQYKLNTPDLWVIHDDLDIELGEYKIQKGKGPKQHKGLISIYESIGKKNFWHVRIGVENKETRSIKNGRRLPGETYVLRNFTDDELVILDNVLDEATDRLIKITENKNGN